MSGVRSRIFRGVGANFFGQIINMAIQVFGLPILVTAWGVELYGEWVILSSLAAFLSMSDVGFTTAASNEMAMSAGRGDQVGATRVFQSVSSLLAGLGAVLAVVLAGVLWLTPLTRYLAISNIRPEQANWILLYLFGSVIANQQLSAVASGFRCAGKNPTGVMVIALSRFAEFVAQAGAAWLGGSPLDAAGAGTAARFIALAVAILGLARSVPWLKLGVQHVSLKELRSLVGPAAAYMGMPLSQALANQGTIQIIGTILGPVAVAIFAAHRTVANVAIQLLTIFKEAVRPEFSIAFGRRDASLQIRLHRAACQWSLWVAAPGCLILILFGRLILEKWTNGRIAADPLLLTIFIGVVLTRTAWYASALVHTSTNRHQNLALWQFCSNLASCLLAIPMTIWFGPYGAAASLVMSEVLMIYATVPSSLTLVGDSCSQFMLAILHPPVLGGLQGASAAGDHGATQNGEKRT